MLSIAFTILFHIIVKMWSCCPLRQQSTDLSSTYDTMLGNPHSTIRQEFSTGFSTGGHLKDWHKALLYHIIHSNVADFWGVGKYIWHHEEYHLIHWQILKSMLYLGGLDFFKLIVGRGSFDYFLKSYPRLFLCYTSIITDPPGNAMYKMLPCKKWYIV